MDIELDILKAALISEENVYTLLENDDNIFLNELNRKVFSLFREIVNEDIQIDMPTLYTRLYRDGIDIDIIKSYIVKLNTSYPVINISHHIDQLKKRNVTLKIKKESENLYQSIRDNKCTFEIMCEKLIELTEIISDNNISDKGITIKELNSSNFDSLFVRQNYIKTQISELDEVIHGLFNGQLVIIAARPSLGKTTLSMQIIQEIKGNGLFFSLETTKQKLYARMLAHYGNVESWKIEFKKFDETEFSRILKAKDIIKNKAANITVYDNVFDFNQICNIIKHKRDINIVVIDYLQLMSHKYGKNRNETIGDMTRRLKRLAKQKNIPIVILSQLSRGVEWQDREPVLSDLRESGEIEQDADIVIFIHRKKDPDNELLDEWFFIVAKNKDGRTGKIATMFEKKYYRFGRSVSDQPVSDNQMEMEYIHD